MNRQEWHGRPHRKGPPRVPWWWILLLVVSAGLLLTGLIRMISTWTQGSAARQATEDLRAVAREAERIPTVTPPAAPSASEKPVQTETPSPSPPIGSPAADPSPSLSPSPTPNPTPVPRLSETAYPDNPGRKTSDRFRALQKENRDIIGWLTVGKIVDEPVVQRDNIFYMDHDVRGESNVNGAVFLDENVSLQTRPAGLILYGHNMRDGGMFGRLRNYEKISFYRSCPILTFDTAYENGRYVIFAAGIVNVEDENAENFLDFFGVITRNIHERERAIETLKKVTPYDCGVDVSPEDQLLLLVTCDGKDEERRIVAARRIREGEAEDSN